MMKVVFIELDMAGFSNTVRRGRTSLHRSPKLWKILLIVVVDEVAITIKISISLSNDPDDVTSRTMYR